MIELVIYSFWLSSKNVNSLTLYPSLRIPFKALMMSPELAPASPVSSPMISLKTKDKWEPSFPSI